MLNSISHKTFFIFLEIQVILKEREERKQRRLLEERGLLPENDSEVANDATEEQNDSNDPGWK